MRMRLQARTILNPDTGDHRNWKTRVEYSKKKKKHIHRLTRDLCRNLQSRSMTSSACSNPRERLAVCGNSALIFSPSCRLLFPSRSRPCTFACVGNDSGRSGKAKVFSSDEKCVAGFNFAWADANETVVILWLSIQIFLHILSVFEISGNKRESHRETKLNPF